MHAPDLGRLLGLELAAGLAEQRVDEQAAAHADAAVDTPHRELDADALERDPPGEHVLVHTVDQRAVEIEKERGPGARPCGSERVSGTGPQRGGNVVGDSVGEGRAVRLAPTPPCRAFGLRYCAPSL